MKAFFVASLLGGVALAPLAAQAAEAGANSQPQLEEVVVTAQKRESKLESTPMTVNVVSGERLADRGVKEIKDLKSAVPGLTLDESPGGLSGVNLRGVGTSAGNQLFEQSVGLFVDGVYHPRGRQFRDSLFDVARVEVIKGSQGVLFGKNTSIGAISVVSQTPGGALGGHLQVEHETEYGSWTTEGAVDLPVSDTFKVRFSGMYDNQAGYMRNFTRNRDEPDSTRYVLRSVMSWDLTSDLNATLKLQYSDLKSTGNPFQLLTPTSPAAAIAAGILNGGGIEYTKYEDSPGAPDTVERQRSYDPALIIKYELPAGFSLTATTGVSGFKFQDGFDSDSTPKAYLLSQFNEKYDQVSQEVRLTSPTGGAVDYIVGAFVMKAKDHYDYKSYYRGWPVAGGLYGLVSQKLNQTELDYAVFGQMNWHISDKLHLNLGGRLNRDEKDATYVKALTDNFGYPAGVLVALVPGSSIKGSVNDTTIDASGTLSYNFTPRSTLYVSVGKGNKGGAFLNTSATAALYPAPFTIPKEVATTYEAGLKGRFLDGRAYGSLAVYHLDITDYQDSYYNSVVRAFQVRSIDAKTTGVEVEGQVQVASWLNVYGNMALNPQAKLANGERMQRSPKFTSMIGARVDHDLTQNLKLSGFAELQHSSPYNHQPASAPGDNTSGTYDLVNLRAQVTYVPAQVDVYVSVANLTEQLYRQFTFGSPLGLGVVGSYNQPRTITVGVRKSF